MVYVKELMLAGKQVQCVEPKGKADVPLPVIIYLHGIGGTGLDELHTAYLLANGGYRVILPDAHLHSDDDRISRAEQNLRFFEIIDQTSQTIKSYYDALLEKQWILDDAFMLAGTSMGGIITAISLKRFTFVKQAAILMGTAKLTEFFNYTLSQLETSPLSEADYHQLLMQVEALDLSKDIDVLNNRRLFIWHGEQDDYVPYHLTEAFVEQLKASGQTSNLTYLTTPNHGHKVNLEARRACAAFFDC